MFFRANLNYETIYCISFISLIFLNFEIDIFTFFGNGERLNSVQVSHTTGILKGDYANVSNYSLPLNLIDLWILIALTQLFFFNFSLFKFEIKSIFNDKRKLALFLSLNMLFIFIFISIFLNSNHYSKNQIFIQIIHLIKIIEMIFGVYLFSIFLKKIEVITFHKAIVIVLLLFSFIGILHSQSIVYNYQIIDDRMSYYGIILIILLALLQIFLVKENINFNSLFWNNLLYFTVLVSLLSCLLCGKRAIFIITILLTFLIIMIVIKKDYKNLFRFRIIKKIVILFFPIFLINTPLLNFNTGEDIKLHKIINKEINGDTNKKINVNTNKEVNVNTNKEVNVNTNKEINGTTNKETFRNSYLTEESKLSSFLQYTFPKDLSIFKMNYADISILINLCNLINVKDFDYNKFDFSTFINVKHKLSTSPSYLRKISNECYLAKMDASASIRIVKITKSFAYLIDNFFVGIGFWATPFLYNFIPDSGMQLLLEIGFLGFVFFIYNIFNYLKLFSNNKIQTQICSLLLLIILLSIFSNPFYDWRIILICFVYIQTIGFVRKESNV